MNFSALTDFLVQQLHTHIRTYSSEKKFTKLLTRRIDLKDIFFDDTRIQSYILDNISDETPTLTSINRKIVYATVSCRIGFISSDRYVSRNHLPLDII